MKELTFTFIGFMGFPLIWYCFISAVKVFKNIKIAKDGMFYKEKYPTQWPKRNKFNLGIVEENLNNPKFFDKTISEMGYNYFEKWDEALRLNRYIDMYKQTAKYHDTKILPDGYR